jgi:O-antigen/teichoic acid export membrane protein
MASQIATLARHTGIYGLGTIVGGISRAVLAPIVARYMSTYDYGKASVVVTMISLLAIVSELGLSSSLIKFANEASDEDERDRIVSTVLVGSLLVGAPIAVLCALFAGPLSAVFLGSADYRMLILIGALGGFGNALIQIGLSFERAFARSFRYFLYTLAKGASALVISIALVVVLHKGAAGLLLGAVIPPAAIGGVIYARLLGRVGMRASRAVFRAVLSFGGPLMPMNIAMWVLGAFDIFLLRRLASGSTALSEVGLYQYAHEMSLVLTLPVMALSLAWPQFLFSKYMMPDGPALFARVQVYFSFFLIAVAFLLSDFAYQFAGIVGGAAFRNSAEVMPLLAASLVFYGLSVLFSSGLYVKGKTKVLAGIVAGSALLNIVLNIILIPRMGKQGAALTAALSNFVMMAAVYGSSQARFPIPYRVGPPAAGILLGIGAIGALRIASSGWSAPIDIAVRAAVAFGFVTALLRLFGLGRRDLRNAFRIARSLGRSGAPEEVL